VAVVGLIVVMLAIAAFSLSGKKSTAHDEALERLFQEKKHSQVIEYYGQHVADFANAPAAYLRVQEAQNALKEAEKKPEPPPSEPEVIAPQPDPPQPEGDPVEPEDAKAKPKGTPTKKKPNFQRAQELENEGTKRLVDSKLEQAARLFLRCLEMAEHPPCHRQLGIIYASQDRTRQSIEHYEKYVELSPNAKDAAQVRDLIKRSKGQE
jgi:tetratricopeptide (TPR) repeat protein